MEHHSSSVIYTIYIQTSASQVLKMPATFGYWKIRGLAQPVRLLYAFVEEDFEDVQYECGPAPDFNRDSWLNVKNTLGLDFPNLPYLIDGDIKITQSNAILRYIGRKYDLCGKTDQEKALVDMMADTAMDFRNGLVRVSYNPKFDELKENYLKDLRAKLQGFENFLDGKDFFIGKEVTFVDFPMYELIDQHLIMDPTCLNDFPKLAAFQKRFEELPTIKKYMASDKFMKVPLNNKMAKFGYE